MIDLTEAIREYQIAVEAPPEERYAALCRYVKRCHEVGRRLPPMTPAEQAAYIADPEGWHF